VHVDLAFIRHLRVIVEMSFHPVAGRCVAGARAQLPDDAVDRDELGFEWITDQHPIQQYRTPIRVTVAVDESRHDRHALGIEDLCLLPSECTDVHGAADGDESAAADGECLGSGPLRIHGTDIRIHDDDVSVARSDRGDRTGSMRPRRDSAHCNAGPSQTKESATSVLVRFHEFFFDRRDGLTVRIVASLIVSHGGTAVSGELTPQTACSLNGTRIRGGE
jgi:hypothetical protein